MALSRSDKRYNAKAIAKNNDAIYSASEYVYKGMNKLGLSYEDQERLAKKFIPLVTQRMEASRDKTAMRAKIQDMNIKKKAVVKAKKNIQG